MKQDKPTIERLRLVMDYWIHHNEEHLKENERWLRSAEEIGLVEAAAELREVVSLWKRMSQCIERARKAVEQGSLETGQPADESKRTQKDSHEHGSEDVHRHIEFHQIGTIRTPYIDHAPRQPVEEDEGEFKIVVHEKYREGLRKLSKFRYIYVIFFLDRMTSSPSLIVTPPWTRGIKVGVFASRSPSRPNPIGISIVRLKKISGNVLYTSGIDALDKTPLLDIKPYSGKLDIKPGAGDGWRKDIEDSDHAIAHPKRKGHPRPDETESSAE